MSDYQITTEAMKAMPPVVTVGAHTFMGLPLPTWVALLTLVYVVLQIGLLLPRYVEGIKTWIKERRNDTDPPR